MRLDRDKGGIIGIPFDNKTQHGDPLLVPGAAYPVPIELCSSNRFAHGFGDWKQDRLTAREIEMLGAMNTITDRDHWHQQICVDSVVAQWTAEFEESGLISPAAWQWCLAELHDKATLYSNTRSVNVLDSASRICKSDELISSSLLQQLNDGIKRLQLREGSSVLDPDRFPLIYGWTRVLDRERVGRQTAVEFAPRGDVLPEPVWRCIYSGMLRCDGSESVGPGQTCTRCRGGMDPWTPPQPWELRGYRFSPVFQWLPCEVSFATKDDDCDDMTITSYINNLHPRRHGYLYNVIAQFINASIEPWNEVLLYRDKPKVPRRIITYGVQMHPSSSKQGIAETMDAVPTQTDLEDSNEANREKQEHMPPFKSQGQVQQQQEGEIREPLPSLEANTRKDRKVTRWAHPEPGASFTYDDWKHGKKLAPIIPPRYAMSSSDHENYRVSLKDSFEQQGLQVVVEIGAIEATANECSLQSSEWQLSGLLNDHIVATTIVFFDSENVTRCSGSLDFSVEAHLDAAAHRWQERSEGAYHPLQPLADIYGFDKTEQMSTYDDVYAPGDQAFQELGNVTMPDGRLIAFPNVLHYRMKTCMLQDPSQPGRRRFLKLYLVDPHYRVFSTRNIAPQSYDWWSEATFEQIDWETHNVPHEIVDCIQKDVEAHEWPMNMARSEHYASEIAQERRQRYERMVEEEVPYYMFCPDFGEPPTSTHLRA